MQRSDRCLTAPSRVLLVVEDSDEDFAAFERIVQRSIQAKAGADAAPIDAIYRCCDGDEALEFLHQKGQYSPKTAPRPSLILLDLNLSGCDGRDVLAHLKQDKRLKGIPVVIFTTSSNPKDIEACYQRGVNGYIIKPIDIQKLVRTIQLFIDYWFEASALPTSDDF